MMLVYQFLPLDKKTRVLDHTSCHIMRFVVAIYGRGFDAQYGYSAVGPAADYKFLPTQTRVVTVEKDPG